MEMKSRIALRVEEMIALNKIGLDISDASMCWIKEPNRRNRNLVVHDEYCYEMGCLDPVPAYTLEDIILKTGGELTYLEESQVWQFCRWRRNQNPDEMVISYGNSLLDAAYQGLIDSFKRSLDFVIMLPNPLKTSK